MVDEGGVPGDEPLLLQPLDALVHRRGRQAGRLAEVGEGHPAVLGEEREDLAVGGLHLRGRHARQASDGSCKDRGVTAQRLMLLDTASLYFRAFFGVPDSVQAPDGTPVNAVRGLLDFIARLVDEYQPTHLVCCWDNDWRPQWRVDLIPSYKAHRVVAVRPGRHPGHRGGARPARGPGADHPRGARGVRHRRRRRRPLRGRRRHRHAGHRRRDARRHRHRRPRPLPARRRRRRGAGALHRPRGRQARAGHRAHGRRRSTRAPPSSTPTSRRCAATPPTACPASPAWATRPPPRLLLLVRRPGRHPSPRPPTPTPHWAPARAARSTRRPTTSTVAPTVVAVARDIDLGARDHALPAEPRRPRGAGRARRAVGPGQPRRAPHRRPRGTLTARGSLASAPSRPPPRA